MVRAARVFGSKSTSPASPRTGVKISKTYAKSTKLNKEGFPAFERTVEEDTLSVLLTNTLSQTFYSTQDEIAKETVEVLKAMAKKDPEFLAKALVYAREKGLMKLAPVVGLAVLSTQEVEGRKILFRKAFQRVCRIPDDVREFVALCRTKEIRQGLGGQVKKVVQHWLRHLSPYHAVKYGSARSEGITIRDILRMTHPRPENPAQCELFGWLVNGWDKVGPEPSPSNPQIWAFEKLKRSEDEKEIVSLIKKYKLPWEVVVPSVKKMTSAVWKALLDDMPYMALLRNLNTMKRHEVLDDKKTVLGIAKRLSDKENVRKSRQFPFRFFNAFNAFDGPQEIRDALADALEASFVNVPEIKGRVCVSNDISSSMDAKPSDKGVTTCADIAGIFGAALFKKSEDVVLIPFDDQAHPEMGKVSRRDSIMTIAKQISRIQGGTDLGAPLRHLKAFGEKVDVFIGITDNEDWSGRGVLTQVEEYRQKINPNLKAVFVTIMPERDWVAPANYPGVWFVQGWSDRVLRYIPMVLEGGQGQVEEIRKINLFEKEAVEPKVSEESVTD